MSKAAELAALIGSQTALSNRNLVINGAFQCSQRGTSTTGGGFLVDRFELNINNTDDISITQSQDSSAPSGFANSWKILATTAESAVAADERVRFRQNIEGQNLQQFAFGTSAAKSMTLSFYVKSNKTGTYAVNLEQDDASRVIGSTYTINAANTWEYKTITVSGDTSGTINNDNGAGLVVSWYLLAGSNYTSTDNTSYGASADGKQAYGHSTTWGQGTNDDFYITGIQLEVGETATPFEHRSYGDELARCQRYYRHFQSDDSSFMPFFGGMCIAGTIAGYVIPMIPKMRSVPTLETSGTASHYEVLHGGTSVLCSAVPAIDAQSELDVLDLRATVASGLTVGDGCYLRASNTTNAYLALDAEL